jgi:flagellar biosynthesis protein FlhA
MPNVVFIGMGAICGVGAWWLREKQRRAALVPAPAPAAAAAASEVRELSWDDVEVVDPIGLEVGYRLIPLVDRAQGGELMARIKGVRKKLSEDLGFLVPAVHIRDNLDLGPNAYRITLQGVPVGEGEAHPDRDLAINPGQLPGGLQGLATRDPAFGLEAVWIDRFRREQAQTQGYTVVDAGTVIATHLSQLLLLHGHELLGHEEAQQLLARLQRVAPKLAEELVPKALSLGVFVKVLQLLLAERVPIRDLRTIGEVLAEHGPRNPDPAALAAVVRVALGRSIVQGLAGIGQELPVITLEPALEQLLGDSLGGQPGADGPGFEPGLAERLVQSVVESSRRQEMAGEPAVLLVAPRLRPWLSRLLRSTLPTLSVLAYNEIPDNRRVRMVTAVGR